MYFIFITYRYFIIIFIYFYSVTLFDNNTSFLLISFISSCTSLFAITIYALFIELVLIISIC